VDQQHEEAVLNSRDRKCTPSDSASRDRQRPGLRPVSRRAMVHFGPLISETRATMAIKFIERNAHVCFEVITRTTTHWWKASGSESKKQYGNQLPHLITLSALASTFGGIVRPICLAVVRLMTSSNFVGCSTGMSAGLAPLR